MRHKIIYTDNYALIVSDEHIKDVRPFMGKYHLEDGLTINKFPDYLTDLGACKLIIAHRPLTDAPILKGVPLLPEFIQDDDVEELAKDKFPYLGSEQVKSDQNRHTDTLRHGFKTGYNKAKETYKYTEEDLIKAIELAQTPLDYDYDQYPFIDEVIQSLQQPKRPKYFECEMEPKYKHIGAVKGIYGSGFRTQNLMYGLPKTITNSQGQKELVGECIYE
jgi:hypothetical protein